MSRNTSSQKNEKSIKIQTKLTIFLVAFMILAIGALWLFQVLLLDKIYEWNKRSEVDKVESGIVSGLGDTDLQAICDAYAERYKVCITIYLVERSSAGSSTAVPIARSDMVPDCIIDCIRAASFIIHKDVIPVRARPAAIHR